MNNIISIVTPSYNQAQFINETIESVLLQKGNFYIDYIIIDGGSQDNSLEIIKKYEKYLQAKCIIKTIDTLNFYINTDETFMFNRCLGISYRWISEKDTGHGNALNKGFKKSVGEIMAWINSDDKYFPGAFEIIIEVFKEFPDVNWIVGKAAQWDSKGNLVYTEDRYKDIMDFLIGNYDFIQQESVFWRRTLWEKAGSYINEDYNFMVDGELWCRFFLFDKLYHINCVLSGYRMHQTNRAILNNKQIHLEMKKAITHMKTNCNCKLINKSKKLNIYWRFYCILNKYYLKLNKIINNRYYDCLVYNNFSWKKIKK